MLATACCSSHSQSLVWFVRFTLPTDPGPSTGSTSNLISLAGECPDHPALALWHSRLVGISRRGRLPSPGSVSPFAVTGLEPSLGNPDSVTVVGPDILSNENSPITLTVDYLFMERLDSQSILMPTRLSVELLPYDGTETLHYSAVLPPGVTIP